MRTRCFLRGGIPNVMGVDCIYLAACDLSSRDFSGYEIAASGINMPFYTSRKCTVTMPLLCRQILKRALCLLLVLVPFPAFAGAEWITHPSAVAGGTRKAVAMQFRREVFFNRVPERLLVQVSADSRYILYINGRRVDAGPSRGDLRHWRYREIDLAPLLRSGKNIIATQIWNDGAASALAQISANTGFYLNAPGEPMGSLLNTGPAWSVRIDTSRSVASGPSQLAKTVGPGKYYAASPPETHDASARRNDWLSAVTSAPDWVAAVTAVGAGQTAPWTLVKDRLPPMRHQPLIAGKLVRSEGIAMSRFPQTPTTIPANTIVTLLFDAGALQAAYPSLVVSGGRGAEITMTYGEALYGKDKNYLADRAQVSGGQVLGLTDTFRTDGSNNSVFQPFWWRTWRFVELRVTTGSEPLQLEKFTRYATGYPFETRARFESDDPALNRIWQIGWDTVQLDAHETFMDTAYWEQLQYIGDTRIQALISYLVSGDARLGVQAMEAFDESKVNGLPQSRWPSRERQSIPPFALLWVGMLHDYWWQNAETSLLQRSLPGVRSVLEYYRSYVKADGLVGTTPGWEFIDWRPTLSNAPWSRDERPKSDRCIITLLYIGSLKQAAELETALGEAGQADANRATANQLSEAVNAQCWSTERGLYADNPDKTVFSQHANALAVLYDVVPKTAQAEIIDRITVRNGDIAAPDGITGTTYYFAFYLARALDHAGLGGRYSELLHTWRGMLKQNFTTWPEEPDPTRSDSHAWSAHPTADLLRIVAGIQPATPGFVKVRIAPHLGALKSLNAAMPHPSGEVSVRYRREGKMLRVNIRLPKSVYGDFVWGGQSVALRGGQNQIKLISND